MAAEITRDMVQQAFYEHTRLRPAWPSQPTPEWEEEHRLLARALDAKPGEIPRALVVRMLRRSRVAQEQPSVRELLATEREPDTVQTIACPRCGGYAYSRPSCPLCNGTGKATRNLGQLIGEYKGKPLYLSGSSYSCPALGLHGYRNDLELKRAVGRKLGQMKRKAASGGQAPRLSR